VVDGVARIIEGLTLVVNRVAVGVEHEYRERISLLIVGVNRPEWLRSRCESDRRHPILAAGARHRLTQIAVIARS
jgi:hypothetical protein